MSGKWTEAAILAALVLISASVLASVTTYPAGSWEYPSALAAAILALSIWRGADLLRAAPLGSSAGESSNVDEADDSVKEELPLRSTLIYLALITALVLTLYFVWFPIAAFVSGVATLRWVFKSGWLNAVVTAALVSGISSGVFSVLDVPLPGSGL